MNRATRTLNPLHFEDLEPHRFEDLIRQLAYSFRQWRHLDATGRLGRDQGLDIRGLEMVTGEVISAPTSREEFGDEEEAAEMVIEEREWRVQCKRYKEIGPKLMRDIVREVIPDGRQAPYGLIVAAACDVSAETISACREEALARGVTEAHLWTKAHLEDMLFQPDNDHLLFVYFGVSLGVRRRSQVQRLRGFIALKRKLLRALALDSVQMTTHKDVLVRDIEDSAYPEEADVPGFSDISCSSWDFGAVLEFSTGGILVSRLTYDGWIKAEGDAWDVLEDSRSKPGTMYADYCEALKGEMPRRAASSEAWRQVPR